MGAGASKNKVTSQDRAVLDLKVQRDKLKRYQKNVKINIMNMYQNKYLMYVIQLNVVIDKEVEAAKLALQQGNKQKALLTLKKKKYQVQLLEKTDQQLMNLEELVSLGNFKRLHN